MIKKLFKKTTTQVSEEKINEKIESSGVLEAKQEENLSFSPSVDLSDYDNFCRYGSAEAYFTDSFNHILTSYPYDGSYSDILDFKNKSHFYTRYLLEDEYPSTTGYVSLNNSLGSIQNSELYSSDTVNLREDPQYIKFDGGLSLLSGSLGSRESYNVYDEDTDRVDNLQLKASKGATVEFWMSGSSQTDATCILDVWNGESLGSATYGRLNIHRLPSSLPSDQFAVTIMSGSTGYENVGIGDLSYENYDASGWNHYAFSFYQEDGTTKVDFYVNSNLEETYSAAATPIGDIEYHKQASLGAYLTRFDSSLSSVSEGWGAFQGSLDEFRFWKTKRTSEQVKNNWFRAIEGGSNRDQYKHDLGVYYKFNEGIVNSTSVDPSDAIILDYSGRVNNGLIQNNTVDTRVQDSAINLAMTTPVRAVEVGTPIIKPDNPTVLAFSTSKLQEAKTHDQQNGSQLSSYIPGWILDDGSDELDHLLQVMASYLDKLFLQIEEFSRLEDVEYYSDIRQVPKTSINSLRSRGFDADSILDNASIFEYFADFNEEGNFEQNLSHIKRELYQNIYNNLIYINKSKGSINSVRNLLRSVGLDEKLVRPVLYSSDSTLKQANKTKIQEKNVQMDFSSENHNNASVYLTDIASDASSDTFISAASGSELDYSSYTMETFVNFPLYFDTESVLYLNNGIDEASIFGNHEASGAHGSTVNDLGGFVVKVERDTTDINRQRARFVFESLGGSGSGFGSSISLVTDYYEVYTNKNWHFSVRFYPTNPTSNEQGSSTSDYTLEFAGKSLDYSGEIEEFSEETTVSNSDALNAIAAPKRFFVGADYTDFSDELTRVYQTDCKILDAKVWYNKLSDTELRSHLENPFSEAMQNLNHDEWFYNTNILQENIQKFKTLVLHWNFSNNGSSDSSGELEVYDISGDYHKTTSRSSLDGFLNSHHNGKGVYFPVSTNVVESVYFEIARPLSPGEVDYQETISILDKDDIFFDINEDVKNYYLKYEISPARQISDDIMDLFADYASYSNIIARPEDKFRLNYKRMENLREHFFLKTQNEIDTNKFFSFFRWVDQSLNTAIVDLMPNALSARSMVERVVESHAFERSKYQVKFPTLEQPAQDYIGGVKSQRELSYNWRLGHSLGYKSLTGEVNNCLWWKKRSLSDTGNVDIDENRDKLKEASNNLTNDVPDRFYDTVSASFYQQNTFFEQYLGGIGTIEFSFSQEVRKEKDFSSLMSVLNSGETFTVSYDGSNVVCLDELIAKHPKGGFTVSDFIISTSDLKFKDSSDFGFLTQQYDFENSTRRNIVETSREIYSESLQSPVTSRLKGNLFDRQINSDGTDTSFTRAESYAVTDSGTSLTYSSVSLNYPRVWFYENEQTKSVVSTRNIKSLHGSSLNYLYDYEIVSTTGRAENPGWWIEAEFSGSIAVSSSLFGTQFFDFEIPDRGRNEHVFVNKFGSPADYLASAQDSFDYVSGEYSPYATVNYRNLFARQFYSKLERPHADDDYNTTDIDYPSTPSFHKATPNVRYVASESGEWDTRYNNPNVTYSIPESEWGYSWIGQNSTNKPVSGSATGVLGSYGEKFDNIMPYIEFRTNLNEAEQVKFYWDYDDAGHSDEKSQEFRGNEDYRLLDYNHFGFHTWTQTKVEFKPQIRDSKKLNIFYDGEEDASRVLFRSSDRDENKTYRIGQNNLKRRESVLSRFKPVELNLGLTNGTTVYTVFIENSLEKVKFSNENIRKEVLGDVKYPNVSSYDETKGAFLYSDTEITLLGASILDCVYPHPSNLGSLQNKRRAFYEDKDQNKKAIELRSWWKTEESERQGGSDLRWFDGVKSTDTTSDDGVSIWPLDYFVDGTTEYFGDLNSPNVPFYSASFVLSGSNVERNVSQFYYHPLMPTAQRFFAGPGYVTGNYSEDPITYDADTEFKFPYYNNVEDSFSDVDKIGQQMSIVPEFRTSEYMEYYLSGSNFQKENYGFLSLPGIAAASGSNEFSSETDEFDSGYNQDFLSLYAVADSIDLSNTVKKEMLEEEGREAWLKINVDAVKKLTPYNGFYPAQRMAQMTSYLYEDHKDYVYGSAAQGDATDTERAMQAFLQPFYSPGIGFNTIKSGLAVDWPTFKGRDLDYVCLSGSLPSGYAEWQEIDPDLSGFGYDVESYTGRYISVFDSLDDPLGTGDEFQLKYFEIDDTYTGFDSFNTITTTNVTSTSTTSVFGLGHWTYSEEGSGLINFMYQDYDGVLTYTAHIANQDASASVSVSQITTFTLDSGNHNNGRNISFAVKSEEYYFVQIDGSTQQEYTLESYESGLSPTIPPGDTNGSTAPGAPNIAFPNSNGAMVVGENYLCVFYFDTTNQEAYIDVFQRVSGTPTTITFLGKIELGTYASDFATFARKIMRIDGDKLYVLFVGESSNGNTPRLFEYDLSTQSVSVGILTCDTRSLDLAPRKIQSLSGSDSIYTSLSLNQRYAVVSRRNFSNEKIYTIICRVDQSNNLYIEDTLSFETGSETRSESGAPQVAINSENGVFVGTTYGEGLTNRNLLGEKGRIVFRKLCSEYLTYYTSVDSANQRGYAPWFYTDRVDASFQAFGGTTSITYQRVVDYEPNLRIPFEAIVDPRLGVPSTPLGSAEINQSTDNKVWWLGPEFYQSDSHDYVYPYFQWTGDEEIARYRLAANNFYGSVPEFFLDGGSFSSFTSLPQEKFKAVEAGKTYYMDLELYSINLEMIRSNDGGFIEIPAANGDDRTGMYWGPSALMGEQSDFSSTSTQDTRYQSINDPAHSPWTPPYYLGKHVARISYTPSVGGSVTIEEILANATVEYIDSDKEKLFNEYGDGDSTTEPSSVAYTARMKMDSSINMFGVTKVKKITFDPTKTTTANDGQSSFVPVGAEDVSTNDGLAWSISPKFECPMFNTLDESGTKADQGNSIWFSKTKQLKDSEGLFLGIKETPQLSTNQGSLIDICGFSVGTTRLGEVAESKTVEEAIVLMPYLENPSARTKNIQGFNFFRVDPILYTLTKQNVESGSPAVSAGQFGTEKDINSTALGDFILNSKKYYIPPFLDFGTNDNILPLVTYLIEFNKELDKDELGDIWNNYLPESGKVVELDAQTLKHKLARYDYFEGTNIPDNTKWLVFKVKRKSEKSYFNKTLTMRDDDRFKFEQFNDSSPKYSYNWPYDFFSLIEKASVDIGFEITTKEDSLDVNLRNFTTSDLEGEGENLSTNRRINTPVIINSED